MIIIDYSGIAMAGAIAIKSQLIGLSKEEAIKLVRHVVINSILSYKKKHSSKFGEVVIACDGKSYWRKESFPQYKASRKKNREASTLDWDTIFYCINNIREELSIYTPYKVIYLDGAEADDVIACLTKKCREAEFGETEEVMIISADTSDMGQLQKYDGVHQFSLSTKKLVKYSKKEASQIVIEMIVKGQQKDGIPPLKETDDFYTNPDSKRATPIYQKLLDEFFDKKKDACKTDLEMRNYDRNQMLCDFEKIPEKVNNDILNEYSKPRYEKFDRMKLMHYMVEKRLGRLLDSVQEF